MIGNTQVSLGSIPARSKLAIRARLLSIAAKAHLSPPVDESEDGISGHYCVMVARLSIVGLQLSIIAVLLQGSLLSRYAEREDFLALSSAAQVARDRAAKAERKWIAYSMQGELDH